MARSRIIFHPEAVREIEKAHSWYVEVLAVAHHRQREGYWLDRVQDR